MVTKSGLGSSPTKSGEIIPVDYEAVREKESVVLEPEDPPTESSRWNLLNPFAARKKRIPLPLTPQEEESSAKEMAGDF